MAPLFRVMLKGFFKKVTSLMAGRKLDAELLDELEEQLIMSDVSLDTAAHLIGALREAARHGQVPTDADAIAVLQGEIAQILGGEAAPLRGNPGGLTVWLFAGVNGVGKTT